MQHNKAANNLALRTQQMISVPPAAPTEPARVASVPQKSFSNVLGKHA